MNGRIESIPQSQNDIPMFSVVIPTHNRPDKLKRALESIVNQNFFDMEVIVVNDGSSVSYDGVIDEFSELITTYINKPESSGVSMARNKGILSAKGVWVAFLDDDDEFHSDYLSELKKHIVRENLDRDFIWGIVKMNEYGENGEFLLSYHNECVLGSGDSLSEASVSIGASYGLCIKRQVLMDVGLFDTSYIVGEDTDLVIRMLESGVNPNYIPVVGVVKHNHMESRLTTGYFKYSDYKIYERLYGEHSEYLDQFPRCAIGFLRWSVYVHYTRKNYKDGNASLSKMMALRPFKMSIIKIYIEMKLVKFNSKVPIVVSSFQALFSFYNKLMKRRRT